ncbi:MAG: BrnA antitoxin family protein [Paracoccaceae bacterium]
MLDIDASILAKLDQLVPIGWHNAHSKAPCQPVKEKVTIRLDADMVQWFRHLGMGCQQRINLVLRCYMDSVISRYVEPIVEYEEAGPRD